MLATAASRSFTPVPLRAGTSISGATTAGTGAFSALAGGGATFAAEGSFFAVLSVLSALSALSVLAVLSYLSYLSFLPGFSILADLSGTTVVFSSTAGSEEHTSELQSPC